MYFKWSNDMEKMEMEGLDTTIQETGAYIHGVY